MVSGVETCALAISPLLKEGGKANGEGREFKAAGKIKGRGAELISLAIL